jgi:hypothetical protein
LARLAESFELVWATMWEQFANTKLVPLTGLPVLPVMLMDTDAESPMPRHLCDIISGNITDKLAAVAEYAEERPLAWLDDQLRWDAQMWAEQRTAAGTPTLLVRTEPWDGLTDSQVDELLAFAASL